MQLRVNQANLNAALPNPTIQPVGNAFEQGQNTAQQRIDQREQNELAAKKDARAQRQQALEQMAKDPRNAPQIAQMHGIAFDENMKALFSNKEMATLTIDGAKIADSVGIENPDTAREFVKVYVQTRGDVLAANTAIQGMQMGKPEKPSYGHIKSVDGALIDVRTGQAIYESPAGRKPPSTTGMTDGYMWGAGGQATPIPGFPFDPYDDPTLPPALRAEGIMLKNQAKGIMPPPPEMVQGYIEKVQQYKQQQGGAPNPQAVPDGLPPPPTLDAMSSTSNAGSSGGGAPAPRKVIKWGEMQ